MRIVSNEELNGVSGGLNMCETAVDAVKDGLSFACSAAKGGKTGQLVCVGVVSVGGNALKNVICAPPAAVEPSSTNENLGKYDMGGSCYSKEGYERKMFEAISSGNTLGGGASMDDYPATRNMC